MPSTEAVQGSIGNGGLYYGDCKRELTVVFNAARVVQMDVDSFCTRCGLTAQGLKVIREYIKSHPGQEKGLSDNAAINRFIMLHEEIRSAAWGFMRDTGLSRGKTTEEINKAVSYTIPYLDGR